MNYVDIFLVIVLLAAMVNGWRKGFLSGVLDLAILGSSVIAAFYFYPYLALHLDDWIPSLGVWNRPVSFIAIFIIVRLVAGAIVAAILRGISQEAHAHEANRLLGLAPGFVNGLINAIIFTALLFSLPLWDGLSREIRESSIANRLSGPSEWIERQLSPVFDEAVKKSMNKMTVEPGSKESAKLPFTVSSPVIRAELETEMLSLVNQERIKEGLMPVKADPEMAEVARAHSRDMFARGYFAHLNPDGKTPFDRMTAAGVKYKAAGENLALAPTLQIAHNGLMNSPGHRANILQKNFGRLGIGVLDGGKYGLMITQNFRD
ncbi:MAG TPA: CvpA family protein [Flavitalea sp.]|nr:CvpA family protein [Flavitalea sp.]